MNGPDPRPDAPAGATPDAAVVTPSNDASSEAAEIDRSESADVLVDQAVSSQDAPASVTDSASRADGGDAHTTRDGGAVFSGSMPKIMVLGSSNETGTCWRAYLWQKLRTAGIMGVDFVGSINTGPDCNVAGYDKDCEARSGTIVTGISAATYRGWFVAHPPDIVLQHFGGADVMSGVAPATVIKTYSVIVEQARTVNPKVIFLVAQHTPEDPTGCGSCDPDTRALNALIPPWAAQITTDESPVLVVDLYTGLDIASDFSDRVHLTTSGSQKVSDRFLAPLLTILKP